MLLTQPVRRARSLALASAGRSSAASTLMSAITTSSSMRVKANRLRQSLCFKPGSISFWFTAH